MGSESVVGSPRVVRSAILDGMEMPSGGIVGGMEGGRWVWTLSGESFELDACSSSFLSKPIHSSCCIQ